MPTADGRPAHRSGPMTVAQLGVDAEMRPNTVRFHLAHLGDAGLVSGVSARTTTRGRPGVLYRATARAFDSGPQHPRLLTEVLMHHFLAEAATHRHPWRVRSVPPRVGAGSPCRTRLVVARRDAAGGSPAHGGAGRKHVTDGTAQFDALLLTHSVNGDSAPNRHP
ncbi:hypothetical protein FAM22021_001104 [Propionibacterium freudenreichii]|nr:hypothetical protein [Propionibacterium freudenreichii]